MKCSYCNYSLDTSQPRETPCPECGRACRSFAPMLEVRRRQWTQFVSCLLAVPVLWVLAVFAVAFIVRLQLGRLPTRPEAALASWYNSTLTLLDAMLPWVLYVTAVTPFATIGALMHLAWRSPRSQRTRLSELFQGRWVILAAAWLATNLLALGLMNADPFAMRRWWW